MTAPWVDGEAVNAQKMYDRIEARLDVLEAAVLSRPIALLRQTVAQSIPNGAFTSLTFTTEDTDTAGGHDTAVNPSRYTAQTTGMYVVLGSYVSGFNNTGGRAARLAVNGAALNGSQVSVQAATASIATGIEVGRLVSLTTGDYVEIQGFQASTVALNTSVTAEAQSQMSVYLLG